MENEVSLMRSGRAYIALSYPNGYWLNVTIEL